MAKILRSIEELEHFLAKQNLQWDGCFLPPKNELALAFPLRIPEHYARLIDWRNPNDPLRLIVIPQSAEKHVRDYELTDPIGDEAHEVVPGLIHRYPDRALLLLTSHCLVHCRFCFRREVVGKVRPVQFARIVEYLQKHPEIREIIFSGGDPFTFPVGFLSSMIHFLSPIRHIRVWRFHTRVPAVDPESMSQEWLDTLKQISHVKLIVVMHIDHPREITPETVTLLEKLHQAGCLVLSQTVLLKGVNDSAETLTQLFRGLINAGVKPYYLHHLDQVVGTHHFRLSIEEGKALYQSLRGHISGVCLPEYVLDLPGGHGKIPISWLEKVGPETYRATTYRGQKIEYVDHAV